jgi:hypothetical protein
MEIAVTRKNPEASAAPVTLSESDITSKRVTRRSLLGSLGLGAGIAATSILGATESAPAADSDAPKKKAPTKKPTSKKTPPKKPAPKEETDSD